MSNRKPRCLASPFYAAGAGSLRDRRYRDSEATLQFDGLTFPTAFSLTRTQSSTSSSCHNPVSKRMPSYSLCHNSSRGRVRCTNWHPRIGHYSFGNRCKQLSAQRATFLGTERSTPFLRFSATIHRGILRHPWIKTYSGPTNGDCRELRESRRPASTDFKCTGKNRASEANTNHDLDRCDARLRVQQFAAYAIRHDRDDRKRGADCVRDACNDE